MIRKRLGEEEKAVRIPPLYVCVNNASASSFIYFHLKLLGVQYLRHPFNASSIATKQVSV